MKKVFNKLVFFLLVCFIFFVVLVQNNSVFALSCEDIPPTQDRIQEKIDCIKAKKIQLASQSKTLFNQIAQFNAQITLAELKILQTEEKISLLGGRINQLEGSLSALSNAFSSRVSETYKMKRLEDPLVFLITSQNLSQFVTRFHYLNRIIKSDKDLLVRLQSAQNTYEGEKDDQETLQSRLEEQNNVLGVQKAAKAGLLAVTKNDEKLYQQLLDQAYVQQRSFLRFVVGQGGATILNNQTKCDSWGCYYNQRDSEWGRNSLGVSGLSVAEYGCLVSSVSMIASHNNINIKPSDIAANPSAFFGETALLLNSFTVNGIRVEKRHYSKSLLDTELAAGRPVVAGLYSGPDHFIVIKEKNGDQYIMHDPFMENGSNRPLSDKYSLSDITSLRLISFN